ncbi:DNA ligase [Dirofilaria immitis]
MQNYNSIYILLIICCISISEVYMLRRHMHKHDIDETPLEINHGDYKLGELLSLRTDDVITERDRVMDIRKGDHLTIDSDH